MTWWNIIRAYLETDWYHSEGSDYTKQHLYINFYISDKNLKLLMKIKILNKCYNHFNSG